MLGLPKHLKQLISLLICSYCLFCWEIWTLWNTKNFCWRNLRVQSFYTISDLQLPHFHQAKSGLYVKMCWSKPGATTCFRTVSFFFSLHPVCFQVGGKYGSEVSYVEHKSSWPYHYLSDKIVQMNREIVIQFCHNLFCISPKFIPVIYKIQLTLTYWCCRIQSTSNIISIKVEK